MPATTWLSLPPAKLGTRNWRERLLQHQGSLAADRNQLERASRLYQQALERFREAGDQGSMMRTYNLLGVVEQKAGRLAEARAWYEKSRELAVQLKDQPGLGDCRPEHRHRLATGRRSRPRAGRRARRPAVLRGSPPLCGGKPADLAGPRQQARMKPTPWSQTRTDPPPPRRPRRRRAPRPRSPRDPRIPRPQGSLQGLQHPLRDRPSPRRPRRCRRVGQEAR